MKCKKCTEYQLCYYKYKLDEFTQENKQDGIEIELELIECKHYNERMKPRE